MGNLQKISNVFQWFLMKKCSQKIEKSNYLNFYFIKLIAFNTNKRLKGFQKYNKWVT